jgi:hypothetical protein
MEIKDLFSLEAADLPLVEHPFHASHTVAQWLANSLQRSRLRLPMQLGKARESSLQDRQLVKALADGELFLVYSGVGSSKPLAPLVRWQEDRSGQPRWELKEPYRLPASWKHSVDALNRWQISPEQLQMRGAGGVGHLSVGSLTTGLQTHHHQQAQTASAGTNNLTLPLGASSTIQPLQGTQNEEKPEEPPEKPEKLHLVVGIFTDGTLNNVDNIQAFHREVEEKCIAPANADPEKIDECREYLRLLMGESYASAPTNVVKLFDLYDYGATVNNAERTVTVKVYEPGAGTKTGEKDSLEGSATGLGNTGVIAQVDRALFAAVERAATEYSGQILLSATFDLFGFSRGAAAARHAANEILKGRDGRLGAMFDQFGLPWPSDISIRFLGLFDTVAGIVNFSELDFSAGNSANNPVDLYVDPHRVGQVVHLVAKDEKRANFSLNSIKFAGGDAPGNFREIELPGGHSDVGGGYHEVQEERLLLHPTLTIKDRNTRWPDKSWQWEQLEGLRERVASEEWIGAHSLALRSGKEPSLWISEKSDVHPPPYGRVDLSLRMHRLVRGEYSEVSRELMLELALASHVPFQISGGEGKAELPSELKSIRSSLLEQVMSGSNEPSLDAEVERLLRQQYIHHSDHYNLLDFLAFGLITRLEVPFDLLRPFKTAENRKRKIFWNK